MSMPAFGYGISSYAKNVSRPDGANLASSSLRVTSYVWHKDSSKRISAKSPQQKYTLPFGFRCDLKSSSSTGIVNSQIASENKNPADNLRGFYICWPCVKNQSFSLVNLTTTQVETFFGELEYLELQLRALGVTMKAMRQASRHKADA